jgi:hypothetical protein
MERGLFSRRADFRNDSYSGDKTLLNKLNNCALFLRYNTAGCLINSRCQVKKINTKMPAFGTYPAPKIGVGVYVEVSFIFHLRK